MATAISILALSLLLLFTPVWTHFALGAAGSTAPGGPGAAAQLSDRTVADLLTLGDFSFDAPDGTPMYTADERSHMRDVQVVLYLFLALAVAAALLVAYSVTSEPSVRDWRAVARGGAGLAIGIAVVGVVGFLAFDIAFELFHRVLFPGGNWAFSAESNLIRLYPQPFWQLSAAALGGLAALGGGAVWLVARRRAAGSAK